MNPKKWLTGVFALALIAFMSGCGVSFSPMTQAPSGTVFVTGKCCRGDAEELEVCAEQRGNHNSAGVQFSSLVCGHPWSEKRRLRGDQPRGGFLLLRGLWRVPAESLAASVASRTCGICVCENEAGASEAGFGFLEFGDVDKGDLEAARFDAGAGARERWRENDHASEGPGIG